MDWTNLIVSVGTWIVQFFESVAYLIRIWIIEPCQDDATYRTGFFLGLGAAFVLGFVSIKLRFWWDAILQYFQPIQAPATTPGPSPLQIYTGCIAGMIKIGIIVALLILILAIAFWGGQ